MIDWYYRDAHSRKIGPLSTEEFEARVSEGEIQARTRVWRSGMLDWTTYEALLASEANSLAFISGPTVSAAPQSRSFSSFIALGTSAASCPPNALGRATSAATPHASLAPAFEFCPGCQGEKPQDLFRELGKRRVCGNCIRQGQIKTRRDRLRNARGADANWLGKYFVRLALAAGAFVAIRILLMEMGGGHSGTTRQPPVPEGLSRPSIPQSFDPAPGGGSAS